MVPSTDAGDHVQPAGSGCTTPRATYRLQLGAGFTFEDATAGGPGRRSLPVAQALERFPVALLRGSAGA